jgi:uncharacterized protein YgbK (DUF1537 family)
MRQTPLPVAIIADDLTGALDTAAPFASHGLDTWLTLPSDTASRGVDAGAEVVALTTESRHLAADQAANRVESAIHRLATLRPQVVFKKIDSILRGNVGAEIVGAMTATCRQHVIIAPSVPSQNRTMRGGTVYVNGVRLSESVDGGGDGETTASAHLPDLLRPLGSLQIHMVSAGRYLRLAVEPGLHSYVVDAESEADLDTIAKFVIQRAPEILPVGAMGLGRALARALGQNASPQKPHVGSGMLLFIVGSRREVSAVQIGALRAAGAAEIEIPAGREPDLDSLLKRVSLEPETSLLVVRPELTAISGVSAQMVAGKLGRAAAAIVQRIGVSALVMAGGDTAAACLECLGAECLHVVGELHDGIAYGTFRGGLRSIPFFTKSGSFGRPDTWTRLAALLRVRSP